MLKSIHFVLLAAILSLATASVLAAGAMDYQNANVPLSPGKLGYVENTPGVKLGSAFANIFLAPAELPKNVINTNNEINMAAGVTLGVVKGLIHMCGREMVGIIDLLTFPLQTEPLTTPQYVWDKFTVETRYSAPLFKLQK